ncbi:MAG: hypothetical protein K5762_03270 [Bacilli bacterium]|nr:hypothetical protein [Bacilli bacterium]
MKKISFAILSLLLMSSCNQTVSSSQEMNDSHSSILSPILESNVLKTFEETSEVKLTTGDKTHLFDTIDNIKANSTQKADSILIEVNEKKEIAPVKMFGAALTHASAHQLMLDKEGKQRKEILEDLFSSKGADFNAIRLPIGASDFHAEEHVFTCCDVKGSDDNLLENFTLEHDSEVIQVIKEIYEIKPDLKIIAVPWSAPAWMKNNTHASSEDLTGPQLCGGTLNDSYLKTFGEYLNEFCYRYYDAGIRIDYLTFQNEPTFNGADYPCMLLTPSQADLLALQLNSTLPECTSLMAYDHNCEAGMYTYLESEFADEEQRLLFSGIAIHGYGSEWIPTGVRNLRDLYPEKEVYMTEITEWEHGSSFDTDLMYVCNNTTIQAYRAGLSGTLYWNLILDSNGGPNIGQKSTCYGVVNIDQNPDGTLNYTKRPSFYGLSAISRMLHIEEGNTTYSLETSYDDDSIMAIGFHKGDKYSIAIANKSYEEKNISVKILNQFYNCSLAERSLLSFTLE